MEKKILRESAYNDYVAVDLVENGLIIGTPIFLRKGKSEKLRWKDREERKLTPCTVEYLGNSQIKVKTDDDFEFETHVIELTTEAY